MPRIYVLYADCGTGGDLDRVLAAEGNVDRIRGPHCYAFYAGQGVFAALAEEEIGTFYLTDFLARQFDTLVWEGLGLDRHPELLPLYFGNYRRLVYLAQNDDAELTKVAESAAARLGLAFERRYTGYGELDGFVNAAAQGNMDGTAHRRDLAGHPGAGDRQAGPADGEAPAGRPFSGSYRPRRDAREAHRDRRLSRGVAPRSA